MTSTTHEIQLFGSIQVRSEGRIISRFRTQKTGAVLAYLALFLRREHLREELVDLFWPESDLDAGRTSLRTCLAALRRDLGAEGPADDILLATRTAVSLNPERISTDVLQFESRLRSAAPAGSSAERIAALTDAVALYRGPLVPGVYQEWAVRERSRYEGLYIAALRELALYLADEGRYSEAIGYMRQALSADPLREELHAGLMRLYYASGNPGAAVKQYQELERRLRDELAAEPAAETRFLLEELRRAPVTSVPRESATHPVPEAERGAVTPASTEKPETGPGKSPSPPPSAPQAQEGRTPAPARLPLQLTRFFGREDEMDALIRMLSPAAGPAANRLVTLTGPAGCGKTRLAVETARRLLDPFDQHVWFVSLAEASDADAIPSSICHALGAPPLANESALDKAAAAFNHGPSLLILDNLEHIAEDGAGIIWQLLSRAASLTCLTTSRQRLGLGGEQEIALEPLKVPEAAATPEALSRYASVKLWVDRAKAVRPDFELNRGNAPAVAALCERLEGLPLALELAAAWSQTLTPAQILARLSHRFDLLKSQRRDLAPRHRTLRAAVEWSYNLLSPPVQRLFARLSVFRGGFRLESAEDVCDEPHALEYLGILRECSLIIAEEVGEEMRFRLLETLRDFAAEQLPPDERDFVSSRHLAHFSAIAAEADSLVHGPDQKRWLDQLSEEHDNFRAALEWCSRHPESARAGLSLAGHLFFFWQVRGYAPEGFRWLTQLLKVIETEFPTRAGEESSTPVDETLERAYRGAGELAYSLGLMARARGYLEHSLAMSRARDYRPGIAFCLTYLGLMDTKEGEIATGRTRLEESLAIWIDPKNEGGMAHTLTCLGINSLAGGDVTGATNKFNSSLELYRRVGNRRGITMVLGEAARATLRQGDFGRTALLLHEQLQLAKEMNDMGHTALALHNLGLTAQKQGQLIEARSYFEQTLSLARELGQRQFVATVLRDMGQIAAETQQVSSARSLLEESLAMAIELDDARLADSVREALEELC